MSSITARSQRGTPNKPFSTQTSPGRYQPRQNRAQGRPRPAQGSERQAHLRGGGAGRPQSGDKGAHQTRSSPKMRQGAQGQGKVRNDSGPAFELRENRHLPPALTTRKPPFGIPQRHSCLTGSFAAGAVAGCGMASVGSRPVPAIGHCNCTVIQMTDSLRKLPDGLLRHVGHS